MSKKLAQIEMTRFPEDWMRTHNIKAIMAVIVIDPEDISIEDDCGYIVQCGQIRVIHEGEIDQATVFTGICRMGPIGPVWSADDIDGLPDADDFSAIGQTNEGIQIIDSAAAQSFEDGLTDAIVFEAAA
tara:strand:+ start:176282 stop:176668 length:387 start_codon:yes stop_codon:yes gene_type:complete